MTRRIQTQSAPVQEQDNRLAMLNSLLVTPHRDLASSFPIHQSMINQDPLFYGHLAAWYAGHGEIRDHKELFVINLCLSDFEGHRDAGLALLREFPPYQMVRVLDYIHGGTAVKTIRTPARGSGRFRTPASTRVEKTKFGLFRNFSNGLKTEVNRYLAEREADEDWFDACVIGARKYMKRLYVLVNRKRPERAGKILFDREPQGERLIAVRQLCKAETAADQARAIIENKIPYRIASTVVTNMTPTVILALIEVMSDQELINNLGSLKRRGAMDNPDIKALIKQRLEGAKKSKRVAALKSVEAAKASGVDEEMAEQLADVADAQVKSKGRIKRPTALLIDKSGSMTEAIEIGKRMASMISAIMDEGVNFYCYAFDTMPYPLQGFGGTDLGAWEKAFRGISANGATCCAAPLVAMKAAGQRVEQIVMIGDEGENRSPAFLKTLQEYKTALNVDPSVMIIRSGSRTTFGQITQLLERAGVQVDAYEFNGDYYSLPNLIHYLTKPSRLELLMEVMTTPLPQRRVA